MCMSTLGPRWRWLRAQTSGWNGPHQRVRVGNKASIHEDTSTHIGVIVDSHHSRESVRVRQSRGVASARLGAVGRKVTHPRSNAADETPVNTPLRGSRCAKSSHRTDLRRDASVSGRYHEGAMPTHKTRSFPSSAWRQLTSTYPCLDTGKGSRVPPPCRTTPPPIALPPEIDSAPRSSGATHQHLPRLGFVLR